MQILDFFFFFFLSSHFILYVLYYSTLHMVVSDMLTNSSDKAGQLDNVNRQHASGCGLH